VPSGDGCLVQIENGSDVNHRYSLLEVRQDSDKIILRQPQRVLAGRIAICGICGKMKTNECSTTPRKGSRGLLVAAAVLETGWIALLVIMAMVR